MSKVFDQMEGENQAPTRFSLKQDDTEMDFDNQTVKTVATSASK